MKKFNRCGRTKSITYDDGITTTPPVLAVEYEYDNNGNLGVLKDHLGNRTVKYLYDAADRLMKVQSQYLTVGWEYDDLNNLTQQKYTVDESYFTYDLRGEADVVTSYTYDKDNRPTKITSQVTGSTKNYNAGLVSANYSYDVYGRNNSTVYKHGEDTDVLTRTIGYVNPTAETTTNVVHTLRNLTNLYDKTYTYTYDDQGNITSISDGTDTITYVYDELNQLVRENNPTLGENGETWVYTYDLGGNITSKTKYNYTTAANPTNGEEPIVYVYGDPNWPDLLTKYNDQEIESDAIGNITNDGTWTYTWQNGRQLAGMTKAGTEIEYTYNSDGMRTSKTVNGTTTKYMYHGGQLVAMDTEFGPVYFHYDGTGVMAMEVQGTMLYYVKNSQGDVVALVDTNGYPVVEYSYDAWGKLLGISGLYATTYGVYNPFRYRGYVYDSETGLYYLQSRYYNPQMGRFICTDDTSVLLVNTSELTDKNIFAYCDNNPVNRADHGGDIWSWVIGAGVGFVTGFVGQVISDVISGERSSWQTYVGAVVGGAVGGAILGGTGNTYLADTVTGAVSTFVGMGLENACGVSDREWYEILMWTLADGAIAGGGSLVLEGMFGKNKWADDFLKMLKGEEVLSLKNISKGIVGNTASGLYYDVWNATKSVSLGRSLGYEPGEKYYYNGLEYTAY